MHYDALYQTEQTIYIHWTFL